MRAPGVGGFDFDSRLLIFIFAASISNVNSSRRVFASSLAVSAKSTRLGRDDVPGLEGDADVLILPPVLDTSTSVGFRPAFKSSRGSTRRAATAYVSLFTDSRWSLTIARRDNSDSSRRPTCRIVAVMSLAESSSAKSSTDRATPAKESDGIAWATARAKLVVASVFVKTNALTKESAMAFACTNFAS